MIQALNKFKLSGLSRQLIRAGISVVLAIAILLLVQMELLPFAILLAVISKWQVAIGGPKLWFHNIWDNAADITVLWSYIALLIPYQPVPAMQWALAGAYLTWQLLIKPLEGEVGRGLQSLFMLGMAIGTIFLFKGTLGIAIMILLGWLVGFISAYHFLAGSEDSPKYLLATVWALIVAQFVWIFAHWLVFYAFFDGRMLLPQAVLVVVALGYVFGGIYRDHSQRRLGKKRLFGYLATISLIVLGVVFGSEWVSQL